MWRLHVNRAEGVSNTHYKTTRYDRYTIKVFCQHCGTYLTTLVGIERDRVQAVRAQLREMAQQHVNEVGA